MAPSIAARMPAGIKPKNKIRRQSIHLSAKKARESAKRDERMRRKREEEREPSLRAERLSRNIPATIDSKRIWDEGEGDETDMLGWAIDVEHLAKRRKLEDGEAEPAENGEDSLLAKLKKRDEAADEGNAEEGQDEDIDSMLDSDLDPDLSDEDDENRWDSNSKLEMKNRASSPAGSTTSTNLEMSPEFLKTKFPQLFAPPPEPKVLITTSLEVSKPVHNIAHILVDFFPNSTYIRRTAHAHAHKYSVREIAQFASARDYTHLVILISDLHRKTAAGLDLVTLPHGPHFHFSITSWTEGKKLPGHGNPTGHIPELILNGFKTPLGILAAHLFKSLYPPSPQLEGRTVVTLQNSRDYIFVRRHRYVFRDKRASEKSAVGTDGKPIQGFEQFRVGLQELGPRMTLKLRRIDKGIQWKSGQEWEWKPKMEKQRLRFNM